MLKRVIKLFISLLVCMYDSAKVFLLWCTKRVPSGTSVILYYHGVKENERKRFAAQMDTVLRISQAGPLNMREIQPGRHHVAITFDDGFVSFIENALPELEKRNIPCTLFVPTACLGERAPWLTSPDHPDYNEIVMTAKQLRELAATGLIKIGSHLMNHPNLCELEEGPARKEIAQSRRDLRQVVCSEIEDLSFPHGAFNDTHIAMAREAGYSNLFSIEPKLACREGVVGRFRVDPADWSLEFRLKVRGAYRWLGLLSPFKAERRSPRGQ